MLRLRGAIQFVGDRGIVVAKRWPRHRGSPRNPKIIYNNEQFKRLVALTKQITDIDKAISLEWAKGTGWTWRDVISRAMTGRLIQYNWLEIAQELGMDVQDVLDQLQSTGVAIIQRASGGWVAIPLGEPNTMLVVNADGDGVEFVAQPAPLTIELVGDVLGTQVGSEIGTSLSATGVAEGVYTLATIEVDTAGRILSAASGSAPSSSPGYQPGFQSGRYYTGIHTETPSSMSVTANRLYAIPIYIPEADVFTKLAIFVGGISGGTADLGVYGNTDGAPSAHEFAGGQVTINATNVLREITGLTIPLDAGWHWLTAWYSSTPAIRAAAGGASGTSNLLGYPSTLANTLPYLGAQATQAYSSGNWPDPFPAITMLQTPIPLVYIGK